MSDWKNCSVESLCSQVTSGGTPRRTHPEYYSPQTVPWVKTGDLTDTVIDRYDDFISAAGMASSAAKLLPASTVLMAMYGATVGKLGILKSKASCNQASCAMVTDSTVCDHRWLFYSLLNAREYIVSRANGAAQQNLSGATIKKLEFLTPPLEEQRAIAEVLGALDDKIAANTSLAATTDDLAGNIYDLAVANIASIPMSNVLRPVLGGTPPRSRDDFWMGDHLWASAKDITGANFGVITNTDEKITAAAVATTKAKPLRVGSVILTARGTVGAVARLSVPASFNQSCYGFEPGDVPAGVLYFSVLRAAQRARAIAHGSVFDTITMKTFDHLPFPALTTESLAATERAIEPLLNVVSTSMVENAQLAATRDALLPQLMSGKLRVKDAEAILENVNL